MAKLAALNHLFLFTSPRRLGGGYSKMHVSASNVAPAGRISSSKLTVGSTMPVLHEQSSICRSPAGSHSPPNWDFNHVQSLQNEYAVIVVFIVCFFLIPFLILFTLENVDCTYMNN